MKRNVVADVGEEDEDEGQEKVFVCRSLGLLRKEMWKDSPSLQQGCFIVPVLCDRRTVVYIICKSLFSAMVDLVMRYSMIPLSLVRAEVGKLGDGICIASQSGLRVV